MDFFLRRRADIHRGQDEFQFLDQDALDLEELNILLRTELLGAAKTDELAELFPALQIVLHLVDELVQFSVLHKRLRLVEVSRSLRGLGSQENDGPAAQFAG